MPELPEVETTARGIEPHLLGQQVIALHVRQPKLRYPVTLVTHAVGWLKRLLPARLMDKILQG